MQYADYQQIHSHELRIGKTRTCASALAKVTMVRLTFKRYATSIPSLTVGTRTKW